MKKFGSGISYLTIDLIKIWKNSNENNFEENRDNYLAVENPPDACYYRQLDYIRMEKLIQFIDNYLDSITPENEMKMEIYFNQEEPAFIDDEGVRIDEWYKLMGKHYYIELFRMAREVFGDKIKLFYNDNNEGNREKQIIFKTVIDNIKQYEKEHGLKLIDGFGMQCHFWGSEEENRTFMEEMFEQCSRFGVELQITEFDVNNHSTKEIQQSIFNNFVQVAQKYGIEVLTTWGLNDIVSWLHGEDASLVDYNCDLKPFTMEYIKAFSGKAVGNKL